MSTEKKYKTIEDVVNDIDASFTWFETYIEIPFCRYILNPVQSFWYNLTRFPSNIKKWGRFVWEDYDWDYANTLKALEIKCRSQAKCLTDGYNTDSKKNALQAYECAEALKRLREDNYGINGDHTNYINNYNEEKHKDIEIIKTSILLMFGWWY